ncbi:MAG: MFS transporter [Myxococcota bacterium]|nr:MFS transporter [Myxococcota bacterium]
MAAEASAQAEEHFQREVREHLRRNYAAHLTHGLLGQTGFRLINAPTFIPAYVDLISGGSALAVGAARAFQSLGMCLSPLLGASLIEHRKKVLPVGFLVGGAMRVQVLGLALAGFFFGGTPALLSVFFFLGLFGFFLGMQGVVFNFLISKVIPVDVRGRLLGLRNALATVTAALVGIVGGRLIDVDLFGNGYAATFLVAFVLTSLGLLSLSFMKEPESPEVRENTRLGARLRDVPALLRADPAFTRFFLARALATMGRMSVPFYVIYAGTQMEISGATLGNLSGAFVIAQGGSNLLWGAVADRSGFRLVFLLSLVLWMASALLLLSTTGEFALLAVMFGLGAGLGGFMMAGQNLVLEFGEREDLPLRIALSNTGSELAGVIGPLLAGVLAMASGYPAVFWTAIAFQAMGLFAVLWLVPDPRHTRA